MNITKFVIADVRFPNEVELVHRLGGKVIRVEAPIRESRSGLSEEARQHPSETSLDGFIGFDGIIYNDPEFAPTVEQQVLLRLGLQTVEISQIDSYD